MKKKILSLMLAALAVVSLMTAASAAESPTYSLNTFNTVDGASRIITADGTLKVAGTNDAGPKYTRNKYPASKFTFQKEMSGVKSVWESQWDSNGIFVLKNDNSLWGWKSYLIGDGTTNYVSSPVKIMSDVACFASGGGAWNSDGYAVRYALKTDGSLWGWGYSNVGDGTEGLHATPIKIMDGVSQLYVIDRIAGTMAKQPETVYVIKYDGSLWGWGADDDFGFYGSACSGRYCLSPVKILDDVKSISGDSGKRTYAVTNNGDMWGWGSYQAGPSVNGVTHFQAFDTKKLAENVASVNGELFIKNDGSLWENQFSYSGKYSAAKLMDGVSWAQVNFGAYFAIKNDGTLWGWGKNYAAGYSSGDGIKTPVKLLDGVSCAYIGFDNYMALKNDGTLWMAGKNQSGEFGNGTTNESRKFVRVAGGVMEPFKSGGLPFVDVRSGAYYYEPVKWAIAKGVTTGTTASTFSPAQTCTQAQILAFLWRAAGNPKAAGTTSYTNSAVTSGKYYYKALQWAAEKGVVTDMTLDPNAKCSRSDAALYLWRYAGSPASSPAAFTDVAADSPYAGAVAWAVEQGVTKGSSATTFSPDSSCTRGQIVTFLYRDLGKQ